MYLKNPFLPPPAIIKADALSLLLSPSSLYLSLVHSLSLHLSIYPTLHLLCLLVVKTGIKIAFLKYSYPF